MARSATKWCWRSPSAGLDLAAPSLHDRRKAAEEFAATHRGVGSGRLCLIETILGDVWPEGYESSGLSRLYPLRLHDCEYAGNEDGRVTDDRLEIEQNEIIGASRQWIVEAAERLHPSAGLAGQSGDPAGREQVG